jgi:hypothetical protein
MCIRDRLPAALADGPVTVSRESLETKDLTPVATGRFAGGRGRVRVDAGPGLFRLSMGGEREVAFVAGEGQTLRIEVGEAGRGLRVLMLDQSGTWVPAVDPLHFDKPAAVGVGLGRTFAADIAAASAPDVVIGLIPCAVGGSPLSAWQPGFYYQPTQSHPWDDAIRRAKLALTAGTLKGILWHQGESDSNREQAPVYAAKLSELIARLRAELAAPTVPFIAGQLGRFEGSPWSEFKIQVDQAHRDLPGKVPHTAFVRSDGLKDKGDKTHFDSDSYREFGKRYAEAYLTLAPR